MTKSVAFIVLVVGISTPVRAEDAHNVIKFDSKLNELREKRIEFGIFRDTNQDPRFQFIQEDHVVVPLPTGEKMGFLQLTYLVDGNGAYNGWWHKTRRTDDPGQAADWSEFGNGALIIRLRKGQPCANLFKFEIKTNGGANVYPAYVRLSKRYLDEMARKGYADVVLPLRAIVGSRETLLRVNEVVVVFEQAKLAPATRGRLLINSLTLVKKLPGR